MNKKLNYFKFDLKTINEFSQQTNVVIGNNKLKI
jgi:hypothetical protein